MKIKKRRLITFLIILGVIILSIIILTRAKAEISENIAKCIGQNAELYTQLGCNGCNTQEELFGENYQYITVIDCWFERNKCLEITHTPTWIIKGEKYPEVYNIEKLKELTGC